MFSNRCLFHVATIALGASLAGCPSPAATETDSGVRDARSASDAPSNQDAFSGNDAGAPGADLARCRAAAAAFAGVCTDDGDRVCHVAEYAAFCNETGQPALYAAALDCLRTNSGAGSCRTFSDPSGAGDCVAAVYASASNAMVTSVTARINALCTTATVVPHVAEPPLWALSTGQLASAQTCLAAATDCVGTEACFATVQAGLRACYE